MKLRIKYLKTNDWKLIKTFAKFFRPHRLWLWLSLISIPITTGLSIAFLWLVEKIIDDHIVQKDVDGLVRYSIFLTIVLVLNFLFDAIYSYCFAKAGNLAIRDMRRTLFRKVIRFPLSYYDKNPIGITLSRLTSDMDSLSESFASGVLGMIADTIKTIALFGYLFYINWQLTLVVLLVIPPIILLISFLRKKMRNAYNIARRSLAQSASYLQETVNGIKTVQLYSAEEQVFEKYDQLNKNFSDAQNRSNVFDASLYSIIEGITSIATALVLMFGATQIWNMDYTIGVLVVFITTLSRLFVPIRQFAQQIATIQRSLSALEHISTIFKQPIDKEAYATETEEFSNLELEEIVFDNVYFKYSEDGPEILKGISFKLKKGDRIALVGSTGSGKSTILKVLTKSYTGYSGSIRINGIELSEIPKSQIVRMMSMMQQDVFMFNDTISFNISLLRDNISQQDIENAAKFVYADRYIQNLPGKYEFKVQENGANLSKGQAQLISFARSIAGESELIILDEATSSVDSVTETYIQKAIENIFSQKTVISIAHRLSTIKNSDLILVLENGEIIEKGNHQQLVKKGGKYAQLLKEVTKPNEN